MGKKMKMEWDSSDDSIIDLPLDYQDEPKTIEIPEQGTCDLEQALFSSLDQLGRIDMEYMSAISNLQIEEIIHRLGSSIYQNPSTWEGSILQGWETANEYLSGNLMDKYQIAVRENEKYSGYFQSNVDALKALLPEWLNSDEIYITLGSPWVPTSIIDEFIYEMFHVTDNDRKRLPHLWSSAFCVRHDSVTGIWEIPEKNRFSVSDWIGEYIGLNHSTWGTSRMGALQILEKSLNLRDIVIYDKVPNIGKKGEKRVVNHPETLKAMEKQNAMIQAFRKWVWKNPNRKRKLQKIYYDKYATIRKRVFDGSFLSLKDLNPNITLYPYQKDAVARILFTPNTLLAHDVGAGKTHIMIVAGMELRRLKKSKKNLYVVPNSIIHQWKEMFLTLYPNANLLVVERKNFTKEKREETLQRIIDEDFDGILMTYSCFDSLPLSKRYYETKYEETMEKYKDVDDFFQSNPIIERKKEKNWKDYFDKASEARPIDQILCFDDLGIQTLFVDEAHNYKNITVDTSIHRVYGISSGGSKKCDLMLDKVHCIQRENLGRGIVFATGTPITNSITDMYVMQKYLQEGQLGLLDILNFDNWVGMFAMKTTQFEIDVDTNQYRMTTRFSRFCNMPELAAIISTVADFHEIDQSAMLPKMEGYQNVILKGEKEFKEYLNEISIRADKVRSGLVSSKDDNMLKITTDGRKAGLDMRLIDPKINPFLPKVKKCAEIVMDIYKKTRNNRSTQLIFCDYSTPKNTFNLYDELKKELYQLGMPIHEIEFIHDATSDTKKEILFEKMNRGEISVLVGSTFKLGTGVNVQSKLIAIHHLDVPWRPSDMVQREGRMIRQGNENEKVQIYRYVTEASFDAYSWQLLEIKQRFINQILSGDHKTREGDDIDDMALDYAEVKALAVGNPLIKDRVETSNELEKYIILQEEYIKEVLHLKRELEKLPALIQEQEERIALCEKDIKDYAGNRYVYNRNEKMDAFRKEVFEGAKNHVNQKEEKKITSFYGFDVKVPKFMFPRFKKITQIDEATLNEVEIMEYVPYVVLSRHGNYVVDIPSEKTIVRQFVYVLEHLDERLEQYQEDLEKFKMQKVTIEEQLKEKKGYDLIIEECKQKLKEIDRKMGIEDGKA